MYSAREKDEYLSLYFIVVWKSETGVLELVEKILKKNLKLFHRYPRN